nr:unnamed protein product [Spirometra erinaceieuropaei]
MVDSGVPQGSVLEAILFLIHVDDAARDLDCEVAMFADDMKIWSVIRGPADEDRLQMNLNRLEEWSNRWLLRFNVAKCTILRLGNTTRSASTRGYFLGGAALQEVEAQKDLGVLTTSSLKPSAHCSRVAKSAMSVLSVSPDLARDVLRKRLEEKYDVTTGLLTFQHLVQLFAFCQRTFFTFDGRTYEQIKGTPLGSPIPSLVAEWILQVQEKTKQDDASAYEIPEPKRAVVTHTLEEGHKFDFANTRILARAGNKTGRELLEVDLGGPGPEQTGVAIYEANWLAAFKPKREARKLQVPRLHNTKHPPLPTCSICQRGFCVRIGLVGYLRTPRAIKTTTSTSSLTLASVTNPVPIVTPRHRQSRCRWPAVAVTIRLALTPASAAAASITTTTTSSRIPLTDERTYDVSSISNITKTPNSSYVDSVHACPYCDCTFISHIILVSHLRIHHTQTGEPVPGSPTYNRGIRPSCPQSPESLPTISSVCCATS